MTCLRQVNRQSDGRTSTNNELCHYEIKLFCSQLKSWLKLTWLSKTYLINTFFFMKWPRQKQTRHGLVFLCKYHQIIANSHRTTENYKYTIDSNHASYWYLQCITYVNLCELIICFNIFLLCIAWHARTQKTIITNVRSKRGDLILTRAMQSVAYPPT